jgi:hypothetical protein
MFIFGHFNLYFRPTAHRNMKHFFPLIFFLLSLSAWAQSSNCNYNMQCKISAPSGMRMRAAPNLKARVVTYVPFDSNLVACTDIFGKMTYEKIEGSWRKVKYKKHEGFMFDGFLSITGIQSTQKLDSATSDSVSTEKSQITKTPDVSPAAIHTNTQSSFFALMTETYNYCGDVSKLDPGLLWYGIYPKDENQANAEFYRIKQVEVDVMLSKQKVGKKLEFDITTADEERSIFLLGLNRPLLYRDIFMKDTGQKLRLAGRKVYPGQQMMLAEGANKMMLSATGSVEEGGPCPVLKNYTLTLSGKKFSKEIKQNIGLLLSGNGSCGMPELYWHGDLTGDGIDEIIFVSVYDDRNVFSLFVSAPNRDDILLEKQAEWIIDKCY